MSLPARGIVGVPHLTVASTTLDFGDIAVDDRTSPHTSEHVLRIANMASCPGCDLTLTSLPITGPNAGDFYVVGAPKLPTTIGAGSELDLSVESNPSRPGPRDATLTVNSDDPTNASVAVSLSSNGLIPAIRTSLGSLVFEPTVFDPVCSGLCGQTLNESITESGPAELFLDTLTISGSSAFSGPGPTSPVTRVEPTNAYLESVTFHPTGGPARAIRGTLHVQDSMAGANPPTIISEDIPLCGESVGRGIRVLAYLPDGTLLPNLDKLSLQSHGVAKATKIAINKSSQLQLQTIDPPMSCQRIQFQYENQDLQAVSTTANRGSYYVLSITAGNHRSTVSFTLGANEFKTIITTVQ